MKTASVILDINTQSLDSSYTYAVPDDMEGVEVGCPVLVEFGRRQAVGYVMSVAPLDEADELPDASKLKPLLAVLGESCFDEHAAALIEHMAYTYIAPLSSCIHLFTPAGRTPKVVKDGDGWRLQKPAKRRARKDAVDDGEPEVRTSNDDLSLTEGQKAAFDAISEAIDGKPDAGRCIVVDGVTGSGKTEVYLRSIGKVLEVGQGAIVLVPEIALTPQTVARFKGRFGNTVAVMHSNMTQAQRYDEWTAVKRGERRVVVGARSALFAPVGRLGIIIIDEEHESTYKQESAPRYHARDIAVWLGDRLGIPVVLGSATPSIESLHACATKPGWRKVDLPERANGKPMPDVEVVDMAKEFHSGSRSMFSKRLTQALFETVDAGHKAVLLLNQRGFANFMLCRDCGFVPECPTCSVSLTYHEVEHALICHHCGRRQPVPARCPECGSPYLRKFGAGTQRVESELKALLEGRDVPVIRMDSDTTSTRNAHEELLKRFARPGASVLLGTQMIAKGLDFDEVTLVGVINADTQLKLPDFRSAERTFDLIQQVAGRAGRGVFAGKVYVQTYVSESVAVQAAAHYDRKRFLIDELPKRKMLRYPPYARIADVLVWGHDAQEVQKAAQALAQRVEAALHDNGGEGWVSFGAAPCLLSKIRNMYRWHILVKAPAGADVSAVLSPVMRSRKASKTVNVACDVDPLSVL
ncbi:Primosomal protein N' [Slackia heliotrinireducens]|uniref:Replication restart protein PriA n=1 Tax=Slackia heliotrinireducens (strain ATCC 29202 / DSM 20476 / NCTC 11029 / RHS 1) TaxID=471855 RepID=C7N540_SLAHD|nr:primosomal protein N' [Slackia heliotrinireducens]ACV22025.1 primosomal protein N' [Slackia heliotrinireducens DSM 20476]VEG99953.1 Primosomal protein N' [Slackia heliotrinireducens]